MSFPSHIESLFSSGISSELEFLSNIYIKYLNSSFWQKKTFSRFEFFIMNESHLANFIRRMKVSLQFDTYFSQAIFALNVGIGDLVPRKSSFTSGLLQRKTFVIHKSFIRLNFAICFYLSHIFHLLLYNAVVTKSFLASFNNITRL